MKDLSNENVINVVSKKNGIEYIQFRRLLQYSDKLVHCYSLKINDFDFRKYDNNNSLLENNYKKVCNEFNLDYSKIVRPYQTHTDNVKIVNDIDTDLNNVDGIITDKKELVTSLTFADCTPLLIYDPVKNIIANVHSGWKGTLQKIGQKAVNKMIKECGCNPKDIICCMGPAIGKCHFEVEDDVKEMFENEFRYTNKIDQIITKGKIINQKQKYFIDTNLINRLMLEECGLLSNNIIESGICTVCNSNYIYSYRAQKELAGRNTSIMCLI